MLSSQTPKTIFFRLGTTVFHATWHIVLILHALGWLTIPEALTGVWQFTLKLMLFFNAILFIALLFFTYLVHRASPVRR